MIKQSPKSVQDEYLQRNREYGATYREGCVYSLSPFIPFTPSYSADLVFRSLVVTRPRCETE
jgi:hypothetical protein